MDREHAAASIRALINGVDPRTGELLPSDGPLTDPDVLRALFAAVEALQERQPRTKQGTRNAPPNAGLPWSPEDHETLLQRWEAGAPIAELAHHFGRTTLGVTSRLVRFGRLEPEAIQGLIPNAAPRPLDGKGPTDRTQII